MKIIYPEKRMVSVWIGTFTSERDFDQSVTRDVEKILNMSMPIESFCEVSFELEDVGLRKLLEGFSGWETFIEEAVSAGQRLNVKKANAALVCYYLKCDDASTQWGRLLFLGSFVGQDVN